MPFVFQSGILGGLFEQGDRFAFLALDIVVTHTQQQLHICIVGFLLQYFPEKIRRFLVILLILIKIKGIIKVTLGRLGQEGQ